MASLNFAAIREWPTALTVRATAILAICWTLISLLEFVIFAIFVSPSLGETFHVAMPTRRGTLDFDINTIPALWTGLIVTVAVTLISVVWMLLIPRLLHASYVWFALVAAFISSYATLVLVSSIAALDGPEQNGADFGASFIPLVVFVVGVLSVSATYGRFNRSATQLPDSTYFS